MKQIPVPFPIDGFSGQLELREPSLNQVTPLLDLMSTDTRGFMLQVLNMSLYEDGVLVENSLDRIGMSHLGDLTDLLMELLGFDKDDEGEIKKTLAPVSTSNTA